MDPPHVGRDGSTYDHATRLVLMAPVITRVDLAIPWYCLVCLDVGQFEAATWARRLLNHEEFDSEAKRMGTVVRVSHLGLTVWYPRAGKEKGLQWQSKS